MSPWIPHLDRFLYFIGVTAIAALIIDVGFYLSPKQASLLQTISQGLVIGFAVQEVIRFKLSRRWISYFRDRWFEAAIALTALTFLAFVGSITARVQTIHPTATLTDITLIYLGLTQGAVLITQIMRGLRSSAAVSRLALRPPQLFILSFAVPIVVGTFLLMMPKATHTPISFVDALFTATSAVCVTGLIVVDTATVFTGLGKTILCILFQIGGLGIMTLTIFFATLFTGSIGVRERILMSEFFSEQNVGQVRYLLAKIGAFTFVIELIGAVLLYYFSGYSFVKLNMEGIYTSVFHSISAFCNAGFSLFTLGLTDPAFRGNYGYGSVIMVLITLGSLGFPVISNFIDVLINRFKKNRRHKVLTTTTRLILSTSIFLVFAGAALIWATESQASFNALKLGDQIYHSLFLSVTARSGGFHIWPTESLSITAMIVVMGLMFVGGSPMSTGGGIKNVTLAIAFLNFRAQVLGFRRIEIFGREIAQESVSRAFAVMAVTIVTLFFGWFLLAIMQPRMNVLDLGFEVISAFGTVGLSRGLTAEFSDASKGILTFLMFAGRVGAVTVLASLFRPPKTHNYHYLKDSVTIY